MPLKFFAARPVPLHLKGVVESELNSLEEQGIISPISCVTQAIPVIWVKKSNGTYRMCVDFKVTLNKNIKSHSIRYLPLKKLAHTADSKYFAKIDLKSAYWQITLHKSQSKRIIDN